MVTNISQKLCEICGIEPIERCKYFTGKEKCILNIPHNACICECVESEYLYPDFEKPENFVKLLELKIRLVSPTGILESTIWHLLTVSYSYGPTYREEFIECLIQYCKDNDDKETEHIKEAIKSQEWKYG